MGQDKPDTSVLEEYKSTLYPYQGDNWEWQGRRDGAVIEFKKDISPLLPLIGK